MFLCVYVLYIVGMIANMIVFALIALLLYVVYTRNSVEGMITLGTSELQSSASLNSVNTDTNTRGSYQQTAQSLLKESEQYPRSQKTMLNILDSDMMRFFDVSPRMVAELRELVASSTGDVTVIRTKIKELEEAQKNAQ